MIGSDIFVFESVISKEECKYIINTIEKYPAWQEAKTVGEIEDHRKTQVDFLVNRYGNNSELYKAHSIIGYNFKKVFEKLATIYSAGEDSTHLFYTNDEGVQILKYQPGEFYKEHIDNGPMTKRIHSCIIYLNDDYEGGETKFKRQDLIFKGKIGDIIFFPSCFTHPHEAMEVISGLKYTAVIWSF
jgi:Rps23 Pro-64 3,4-dihydroxylase Tpa1-like proline 4-hydroxylase